jgi:hypothetical protein
MRSLGIVTLIVGAAACAPAATQAQRQVEHRGFWISPGLEFAATFSDPLNAEGGDDPELGGGLAVRLGGTLSQHVLIGGEVSAWSVGGSIIRGHTGVSLLYYPGDNGGAFGHALVGIAHRAVSYTALWTIDGVVQFVDLEETSEGLGLAAGIGYDLRLTQNFFLTPGVDGVFQYLADHWAPIVMVTLNVTWH